METKQNEGLKRELGILDVAINVINISIASGIFLLPAIIAGILGNASIVAYILCGLMFLLIALCFAELGSRIITSGGAYAYIEKAFGLYFGFIANGLLWFGAGVLAAAALINGIADMLSVPFPIFTIPVYRGILFLSCFVFFAYVNIKGIKQGMVIVKTITLIKALPLVLLVIAGLLTIDTANLNWEGFPAFDKLGAASIILFFAFVGGETALNISGEMKNPNRTAPLGLLLGVISIVIFFSLIQIVAQSTLGTELNHQKAPLAAAAGKLLGGWSITMLIACGVIAIFSSLYSLVLVFSRVLFAGANDGLLPGFLSKVHPRYATPHVAIITFSIISFLMTISGGFKQLLILATISMLLLYVGVALAVIKFRVKKTAEYPAAFILPGGLSIPILTLIINGWFLFQSKSNEVLGMGIFLSMLSIIYMLKMFFAKRGLKKSIV
ncbi:MAG: amino acid permease [Bacteroidota bacterium]